MMPVGPARKEEEPKERGNMKKEGKEAFEPGFIRVERPATTSWEPLQQHIAKGSAR